MGKNAANGWAKTAIRRRKRRRAVRCLCCRVWWTFGHTKAEASRQIRLGAMGSAKPCIHAVFAQVVVICFVFTLISAPFDGARFVWGELGRCDVLDEAIDSFIRIAFNFGFLKHRVYRIDCMGWLKYMVPVDCCEWNERVELVGDTWIRWP